MNKDGFGRQLRTTGPGDAEHPDHVASVDIQSRQVIRLHVIPKCNTHVGCKHSTEQNDTNGTM